MNLKTCSENTLFYGNIMISTVLLPIEPMTAARTNATVANLVEPCSGCMPSREWRQGAAGSHFLPALCRASQHT